MGEYAVPLGDNLPKIALGFGLLAVSMWAVGAAGAAAMAVLVGFGAMAIGVAALALAFGLFSDLELKAITSFGDAIANLTFARAAAFATSMKAFKDGMSAASNAGSDVLVQTTALVSGISAAGEGVTRAKTLPAPERRSSMGLQQPIEVIVNIGEGKVIELVKKVIEPELRKIYNRRTDPNLIPGSTE
jgi:hypothetical protein